jgi:transcriptional regulator with XRE-family HTH domain
MKQPKFKSKEFSKAISAARKTLNVGVRGLKPLTGCSAATISRLENENKPDIISYAAICKWLQVPLETFIK